MALRLGRRRSSAAPLIVKGFLYPPQKSRTSTNEPHESKPIERQADPWGSFLQSDMFILCSYALISFAGVVFFSKICYNEKNALIPQRESHDPSERPHGASRHRPRRLHMVKEARYGIPIQRDPQAHPDPRAGDPRYGIGQGWG